MSKHHIDLPNKACPNCQAGERFYHPETGLQPSYVAGRCGHRVAGTEWRAGFRTCERCPDPGCRNCIHSRSRSSDLYPTPTRRWLLAEIDANAVWQEFFTDQPGEIRLRTGRKVTAAVQQMIDAGWCRHHPDDHDLHVRRLQLTKTGQAIKKGEHN